MNPETPSLIIGLVGRQGSGKGTTAKILMERYGATTVRYSDLLREMLDILAIDVTRENLVKLSETLRATFGEDTFAFAVDARIRRIGTPLVVVDGIRRVDDIAALESLPHFRLIEVTASARQRFDRMKLRGEKMRERDMTWDEFVMEEIAPTENSISDIASRAWKSIDNAGTVEELMRQIDAVMVELGLPPKV
ncbi:MAG: AAA family ATPase [Patescibacteria group bacterium]